MRKLVLDHLPRCESLYFNCYNARMLSYLKQRGRPVELLFCRSFEGVRRALEECVDKGKKRWNYEASSIITADDLRWLGVQAQACYYSTEQEGMAMIRRAVDEEQLILLFTQLRYLEHRRNTVEAKHAVFVAGYELEADAPRFFVLDDNEVGLGDYYPYPLGLEEMKRSLAEARYFIRFSFGPLDVEAARDYFRMSAFPPAHRLGNQVPELRFLLRSLDYTGGIREIPPVAERIVEALIVLTGSRATFARFCRYIEAEGDLADRLEESARLYQVLRNVLYKYMITGEIDLVKLEGLLDEAEDNEAYILASMRAGPSRRAVPVGAEGESGRGGAEWTKIG